MRLLTASSANESTWAQLVLGAIVVVVVVATEAVVVGGGVTGPGGGTGKIGDVVV